MKHVYSVNKVVTRNRSPDERSKKPFECIHTDIAGPIEPAAKDGFRYAINFVDDYSGITLIYFLKQKSDATRALQKFYVIQLDMERLRDYDPIMAENTYQKNLRMFCSKIKLHTNLVHLTHLIRMAQLSAIGVLFSKWPVLCCWNQNYLSIYGLMQ